MPTRVDFLTLASFVDCLHCLNLIRIHPLETQTPLAPMTKKLFKYSLLLNLKALLLLSCLFVGASSLQADVTLTPTDDSDIHNYASAGQMGISLYEHSFVRFDVSSMSTTTQATLRIYQFGYHLPMTMYVGAGAHDAWSENNLASLPPRIQIYNDPAAQLDSIAVSAAGYLEFDVTDFVNSQISGDGIVTLEISGNASWNSLSSKEGNNTPQLVIATSDPAPPAISELLLYEDFDTYSGGEGSSVGNNSGGAYTTVNSGAVFGSNLSFSGITTEGLSIIPAVGFGGVNGTVDNSDSYESGGTYYMSALFRVSGGSTWGAGPTLAVTLNENGSHLTRGLTFGIAHGQ